MDMLDYCKTFNMVKSSYANQESTDLTSQEARQLGGSQKNHENNDGDMLVETVESLSTKPGDLSIYGPDTQIDKDIGNSGEKKLSTLNEVARKKGMISTLNTKTQQRLNFECELTFAPKLNALSIKLAKERGVKVRSSSDRKTYYAADEFTFKPKVSSNSVKIVQQLKTTFMDRQQMHVEKQKRYIEATINNSNQAKDKFTPVPDKVSSRSPTRLKKISKIKEARSAEEDDQKLSDESSMTSPEVLVSTLAPDFLTTHTISTSIGTDRRGSQEKSDEQSDLNSLSSNDFTRKTKSTGKISENAVNRANAAYQKFQETSPYNQSLENLSLKRGKRVLKAARKRTITHPPAKLVTTESNNNSPGWDESTKVKITGKQKTSHSRSHSQPNSQPGKKSYDDPMFDKVRNATKVAENAIKKKKVFICHGPYPIVRAVLRKRGYVEKHYKGSLLPTKNKKNESDGRDDDNSCDSGDESDNEMSPRKDAKAASNLLAKSHRASKTKTRAVVNVSKNSNDDDGDDGSCCDDSDTDSTDNEDWNAGYDGNGPDCEFSLMSRTVRNAVASFIWTTKRDDVDFKFLRKDQLVNHYSKASSLTTKFGLTTNLRNLKWYEEADHYTFFPRSHLLGSDDEKMDFIDDYRLTAAVSIVKWVVQRYENGNTDDKPASNEEPLPPDQGHATPKTTSAELRNSATSRETSKAGSQATSRASSHSVSNVVPVKALTLALEACRDFLKCKEHLDIDEPLNKGPAISEDSWKLLLVYYYQVKSPGTVIATAYPFLKECQNIMKQMKEYLPQIEIDGTKNIWIVKPGAKSRGRGIMCMDRLDQIVKLVGSNAVGKKEGHLVVQKYIERPLLIHGVKFDIRQWFLVTDWNPLTLWFYKDCYIRFCSQNFSLEDFHISIHLANNSIQKHFENGVRDKRIPDENMWSSDDLKAYLTKRGVGEMWEESIYPGMKKAVISAVQSCQEIVEYRKNSFELYGADFIIGEDYKPWLLEINCSPTMGPSTAVTRKLCAQVLEDTMRVVLDRREDKNCDTGRYELAFKQPQVSAPPYIGMNMAVEGEGIRKPTANAKKHNELTTPRVIPSSKNKDASTETKAAAVSQHKQMSPEANNTKISTLSRPKEARNIIANLSGEALETLNTKNRRETKRKPEGSWATGSMYVAQSIPIATTFCSTDDGKLKGIIKRSKSRYSTNVVTTEMQPRVPRAMQIPKAVLKYSNDSRMRQRTQLPISIGPDSNGKHF
ncbi:tubulin monoglycylase TTLL3-like [Stylophora pistillata]|uniref:Tubulin monoglycylase TTLL3 n=1 Tax=Stylophora pistillata TaxID=50429 RepID=A0A2B4SLI9_STYPI|nr:tubulin monoglycylase TTLL3-like [Stylophora pistillata]PFX29352.1 Tubulin monoglycylase TTLL3 [Stylophora pistillata]